MENLGVMTLADSDDGDSTKSDIQLGKLQFSLDYDFTKGEVRLYLNDLLRKLYIHLTVNTSDQSCHYKI